ncbi:MAG: tetratricopeptide repeat protein, partial [Alphaproteobacteria bacterium]|nr:tetratricopeptide repeat protein [Alphaproteobacteria bacterium]
MDNELAALRARLSENPDDVEVLTALEAALIAGADWEGLVALTAERAAGLDDEAQAGVWVRLVQGLEAHAESLEEPEAVSAILRVTGGVCEGHLGDDEEAIIRYQRAFELDRTNFGALEAARRTYARHGEWGLVLQLMNLQLEHTPTPADQAALYLGMADLLSHRLGRTDDAVACVRRALELVPDHPGAKPYLSLLDSVHAERKARFDAAVEAADKARDGRRRSARLVEAANLWMEESPEDEQIEVLLRKALEADPRNEHGRILLEQFFERNGRWADLVEWLELRVRQTARKSDRLATYQRLAQIAQHDLGDPDQAVNWHREVLKLSPVEHESLNYCVDYFSEREDWLELVEVYEAALRVRSRGGNEAAMLIQIAMILWRKVEDLDAAEGYFKRIKLNDPRNGLMLQFYTEFYAAKEDHKRLLSVLSTRQNIDARDAGKVALGLQMADVAENQLGNKEKAIDVWKSVLKIDPDHAEAREALRRLFNETRKWNALLEFLKEDLSRLPEDDVPAQVAAHLQMIAIYQDELRLPVMVVNTYNQILQIDPGNAEALDALEERYREGGRWNDLIGVLTRRAEQAQADGDDAAVIDLYRQIASLWKDRFSNPNQAIDFLEGILALAPADAQAIAELTEIYQHRKEWPALYATHERRLALLEGDARTELIAEMAEIADHRLGERDQAIDLWQTVLAARPGDDAALGHLEQLYQRSARWEALASLYTARAASAEGDDRIEWTKKLAHLLADTIDDEDRAAAAWHQVLALQPGELHAESYLRELYLRRGDWDGLEALFGARGDWDGCLRQLSAAAERHEALDVRLSLYRRMAVICAERLQNIPAAVECWERILQEDADNGEAAEVLAPFYAEHEAWDPLAIVLEVILRNDPAEPIAVMTDLVRVHEAHRGDLQSAFGWSLRALAAAPADADRLTEAQRLAESVGGWGELAALLNDLVDADAAGAVPLRRVLAATLDVQLGRLDEAIEQYEALRDAVGDEPGLLAALESLYERQARWPALLDVRQARLAATEVPAEQAALLASIGGLYETVLEDPDAARETFEALHGLEPENLLALQGLQRLAERAGDLEGLVGYVEAERGLAGSPEALADLEFRLGQLAERLEDADGALDAYGRVLAESPAHGPTLAALEQFLDGPDAARAAALLEPAARSAGRWEFLMRVVALQAREESDLAVKARRTREVAELQEEKLGDAAGAFGTWQRLLALDPADGSVRAELERLAGALDGWETLAQHFGRFALEGDLCPEDAALAARYAHWQAAILDARLGRLAEARSALESVLRERGDDAGTLAALDSLNTRLTDWRALVDVCERQVGLHEDAAGQIEVLFRIGDLWEELLEEPAAAIDVYRRVLTLDGGNQRAVAALERIFRNIGRYQDLADLLEERLAEAGTPADQVELGFQLGQVLEAHLDDPASALERYAEVLELAPEHEPSQEAIFGLVADAEGPGATAVRLRACDVLEPVLEQAGDHGSLVSLLQVRLGESQDPTEQIELHQRIAALYEQQMGEPNAAFAALAEAFALDRASAPLVDELERLAGALNGWDRLVATLREGLSAEPPLEGDARLAILARLAVIYEERIADAEEAVIWNQEVLAEAPDDAQALVRLDRLFLDLGRPDALAEILEQRLLVEGEAPERARIAFRLGSLYQDGLDRPDDAVRAFTAAREEVPEDDVRAHGALERLYGAIGNHEALVEVLQDHAERLTNVTEARALRRKAGRVLEEALGRPEDAVGLLHQLLEEDESDTEVLAELDRLYGVLDRPADLLDILERRLALAADDGERDRFGLRMGALHRDAMEALPRAVEAFAAVLARTPEHPEARQALEGLLDTPEVRLEVAAILVPLYEREQAWAALSATLRRTLPDRLEADDRVATLRWIATVEETHLANGRAAYEALAEAYRISEADPTIEQEVERLAEGLALWGPLAELFAEAAALSGERAAALRLKVAELAEARLHDAPRAIAELREALETEPDSGVALDGLERLYAATEQPAELVEILERKVELVDAVEARPLLGRVAALQADVLGDASAAIETWRRILMEDERDEEALEALEDLLRLEERWSELAGHLEHAQEVAEGEARVAVTFRLAQVCRQSLGDGERALALYRDVLAAQPAHPGAARALAELFDAPGAAEQAGVDRLEVAQMLEPLRRTADDAAGLVAVLLVQQEGAADAERQRALLDEVATLREAKLGDAAGAFDARGQALLIAPHDAANREALHRLAEQTYRWDDLAELLESAAAGANEPSLRVALLMALGRLEESHRGQDAKARDVYREVLGVQPGHGPAISALVELFTRTTAWEALVELHLELAGEADEVAGQLSHLFKACQLLEDVVNDKERAILTYRQVLEAAPENEQAFRALERFFTVDARHADMADLLRDRIEVSEDDAQRAELRFQLAQVLEERLDDVDAAIEALRIIVEDEAPADPRAIESLERLLMEQEAPDRQLKVVEILDPLYAEAGQWSDWVTAQEVRLEHEQDPWQRVDLLSRMAKTHEQKREDKAAAFAAWVRAFALDYGNPELQTELDRLAGELEAWGPLVDCYLAGIEQFADLDGAVAILLKVAGVLDAKLNERDRAIACYDRVLLADDGNVAALDALERLLAAEERHEALVAVLGRKADQTLDPVEKKELLYRIAELHEEVLDEAEAAIHTWRQIFDEDPEDQTAIDALVRLYEREGQWTQLVLVLREKLELAEDDAGRKGVLQRIATVQESKLEDLEETILTWRTVLEADGRDRDALEALDRLFSREGRWGELVDLLEGERDLYLDDDRARADGIELRIGDILEHRQGQVAQAIELYSELLTRPHEEDAARAALERLLGDEAHRLAAARVLEPHYEAAERHEDLARILELQLLDLEEPLDRLGLLKRLASLRQDVLDHPKAAFESWGRAFDEDPSDPTVLGALDGLADSLGAHAELAALFAARLPTVLDGHTQVDLNRRLARLADQRLEDPARAITCWQAVLLADDYDREALAALDRLHQAQQNWGALIDVLRRRVDQGDEGELADLRFRLGYLLEAVEGDVGGAVELYRSVLWDQPEHSYSREAMERLAVHPEHRRGIAEVLDPIYREGEHWDKLAILTEMRIELEQDPRERARLWIEAAELRQDKLKDGEHAFDRLLRAFHEVPEDLDVRQRLVSLGETREAWEALTDAFEAVSARVEDIDLKLGDHLRMADWSRSRLSDLDRAIAHYRAALEIAPENEVALNALEALFERRGDHEALAAIVEQRAEMAFDLEEKRRRFHRLGALAAEALGDVPRAVAAYEQALEIDDSDTAALDALEGLHEGAEDWPALLAVLERRLDSTYDGEALARLHRRIGALARDRLDDLAHAAESFERVLELEPDARPVMTELRELYTRLSAWDRLQDVLVKALSVAEDGAERREALLALGDNADRRLDRVDDAVEYLRQVFLMDEADAGVADRLASLYGRGERWFDQVETLRAHLAAVGEAMPSERRIELLVKVATLAERELHDADLAIETLNTVLATEANHVGALGVLARLYERNAEWDKAAETLERSLEHAAAGPQRAAARRQLGLLYLERLDDEAQGRVHLEAALDEAEDGEALGALLGLAERSGDDAAVLALTERQLASVDGAARLPGLKRVASLRQQAGDGPGWLAALEEA